MKNINNFSVKLSTQNLVYPSIINHYFEMQLLRITFTLREGDEVGIANIKTHESFIYPIS